MNTALHADTLVIGGGVVGLSVAYGLAKAGERVELLDGADDAFRAARGNFGLVWVQGKGHANADYARWTMAAAREWPTLSAEALTLHCARSAGSTCALMKQSSRKAPMNSNRSAKRCKSTTPTKCLISSKCVR